MNKTCKSWTACKKNIVQNVQNKYGCELLRTGAGTDPMGVTVFRSVYGFRLTLNESILVDFQKRFII